MLSVQKWSRYGEFYVGIFVSERCAERGRFVRKDRQTPPLPFPQLGSYLAAPLLRQIHRRAKKRGTPQ